MSNAERFREVYLVKLTEAIQRQPDEYHYPLSEVPRVVDKMIPSLATGGANLGPAVKATARALKIKPTIGAIKAFLSEGSK